MERKIELDLLEWKNSADRKPLILQGARQVGKTYTVLSFGKKYYQSCIYFNFENNSELANIFERDLEPERIVMELSAKSGQSIFYWESNGKAEIDFVMQDKEGNIIPVEVKSGEHTKAKSLGVFCSKYQCDYSIRISGKNFGFENGIKAVPLYAVWLI